MLQSQKDLFEKLLVEKMDDDEHIHFTSFWNGKNDENELTVIEVPIKGTYTFWDNLSILMAKVYEDNTATPIEFSDYYLNGFFKIENNLAIYTIY
jgi:hypothetical protein